MLLEHFREWVAILEIVLSWPISCKPFPANRPWAGIVEQTQCIGQIWRTIPYVGIKIRSGVESNGVLAYESLQRRAVIPRAVIGQAGPIIFPARELEWRGC